MRWPSPSLLRWSAAVVVGFLLAELAVRALSPALGPPLEFYVPVAQAKVRQLSADHGAGSHFDVLFVGNSTTVEGVDIAAFERASCCGATGYNAGLNGANSHIVRRYTLEQLVPLARPRVVVYGLAAGAYVPASAPATAQYDGAPATAVRRPSAVKRWAEHLALYRYRNTLRDPLTLMSLAKSIVGHGPSAMLDKVASDYDDHGDKRGRTTVALPAAPLPLSVQNTPVVIQAASRHDLQLMARQLARQHVQLVLVDMPETVRTDGFTEASRQLAEQLGVPFVDASSAISDADRFTDPVHLNARGAVELGTWLGKALAPFLDGRSAPTPGQ